MNMQYKSKNGTLYAVMLLLVMIGIVDTAYLTYAHYTGTPVACPDSGVINCAKVLSSPYSAIFGIPLGFIGFIFLAALTSSSPSSIEYISINLDISSPYINSI